MNSESGIKYDLWRNGIQKIVLYNEKGQTLSCDKSSFYHIKEDELNFSGKEFRSNIDFLKVHKEIKHRKKENLTRKEVFLLSMGKDWNNETKYSLYIPCEFSLISNIQRKDETGTEYDLYDYYEVLLNEGITVLYRNFSFDTERDKTIYEPKEINRIYFVQYKGTELTQYGKELEEIQKDFNQILGEYKTNNIYISDIAKLLEKYEIKKK